jgi:hypothetical protein
VFSSLRIADQGRCGGVDTLFGIEYGSGEYPSISTSYEGTEFHIRVDPRSGCDRSSEVIELVTELLALSGS